MKKKDKSLLMLLLACILTVTGTVMAIAASSSDFKVIVDTDKEVYDEGEDINMSIGFENNATDVTVVGV